MERNKQKQLNVFQTEVFKKHDEALKEKEENIKKKMELKEKQKQEKTKQAKERKMELLQEKIEEWKDKLERKSRQPSFREASKVFSERAEKAKKSKSSLDNFHQALLDYKLINITNNCIKLF